MTSASDWNENPSSFFRDEGINLDLEKSPIATAYLCLENIDRRKKVDTIRARLIKTAFYRLKIRSSLRYMRSNNVDDIASIVYNSGLVRCNLDTMKRNIVRWTDQGGRINALCQSIGGSSTDEDSYLGNLFCLPEDCHDELSVTWIKTRKPRLLTIAKHKSFGYKGSYRDQQIQNIKDRGILNVQGRAVMDKLAAKVFNVLWESIRASIDAFITQSPQSALGEDRQVTDNNVINALPCVRKLQQKVEKRKKIRDSCTLRRVSEYEKANSKYRRALQELRNEKQLQRAHRVRENLQRYKNEQPVIDSERQLAGKIVDEEVIGALERTGYISLQHMTLIDTVLTTPGTTIEKKYRICGF